MGAYQRMTDQLKPLNLYNLSGGTLIDLELKEYGKYIDSTESAITKLFSSFFLESITYISGTNLINLYSLPMNISNSEIISVVKKRMKISNTDFTHAGVLLCLDAGGFECTLSENFTTRTVTVTAKIVKNYFATNTDRTNYIKSCLPCHVNAVVTFI